MSELRKHKVPDGVRRGASDEWVLDVGGDVDHPSQFSYDDLQGLDAVRHVDDFECEAGWSTGDLTWRGVRLAAILEHAEPASDATHALVHAMDGDYACALTLDRARSAVLAFELDGDLLPVEHGGPARLVPTDDADCWEQVKWVDRVSIHVGKPESADTAAERALSRLD